MHQTWQQIKIQFEKFAKQYLNAQAIPSARLKQAMVYSFLGGGKRIRALFCYISGACFGTDLENQNLSAVAIEAIHAYSLIHDDLPAMDDASLRRGNHACHIRFDEATAILAGDALQSLAYEALSQTSNITVVQLKKVLHLLATHAGSQGMVAGQQLDIDAESQEVSVINLKQIHLQKTGKIFKAAILIPFYLSQSYCEYEILEHLSNFAENIGLAFQIKDDILDATAKTTKLGKNANSDKKSNKATYPLVFGIEKAIDLLNTLIDSSKNNLSKITNYNTEGLLRVAEYISQRNY